MLNCAWCGATDQSECKNQKNCHMDKQSDGWGCMDYIDILAKHGTFNANECTSSDDLCKLLDKQSIDNPTNWKEWITSQIEQEGVEKYKEWYGRMLQRGAICDEMMEANDELFGGEKLCE